MIVFPEIYCGDAIEKLRLLRDRSVQCVVTSPPYFNLRDYEVTGQIGLEKTPAEYVAALVAVFHELRRVLRDDGVAWLNLGDCYGRNKQGLLMIPARVALALQLDGWFLNSKIVWYKPNVIPESVKSRPTSSYEEVFLLAKRSTYFYDHEAIKEPAVSDHASGNGFKRPSRLTYADKNGARGDDRQWTGVGGKRNARNVWVITTKPSKDLHFAIMPVELAERCIKAGTSEHGCCSTCRAPYVRQTTKGEPDIAWMQKSGADSSGAYNGQSTKGHKAHGIQDASDVKRRILEGMRPTITTGWKPTCTCQNASVTPCRVLDPFAGVGTTGVAAIRLGRAVTLIDLKQDYCDMATARIVKEMENAIRVQTVSSHPDRRDATVPVRRATGSKDQYLGTRSRSGLAETGRHDRQKSEEP